MLYKKLEDIGLNRASMARRVGVSHQGLQYALKEKPTLKWLKLIRRDLTSIVSKIEKLIKRLDNEIQKTEKL